MYIGADLYVVPHHNRNTYEVWGTSSTNVWFGRHHRVLQYDPTVYTEYLLPVDVGVVNGLWVAPSGEVFAAGCGPDIFRWIDGAWRTDSHPLSNQQTCIREVWGTSAAAVWAVGYSFDENDDRIGVILRWDGVGWSVARTSLEDVAYWSVWGTDDASTVYVGGVYGIIRGPDSWVKVDGLPGTIGLTGTSGSDVYAMSSSRLLHFDGAAWDTIAAPFISYTESNYGGIWAAPSGEVFLVGRLRGAGFIAKGQVVPAPGLVGRTNQD